MCTISTHPFIVTSFIGCIYRMNCNEKEKLSEEDSTIIHIYVGYSSY